MGVVIGLFIICWTPFFALSFTYSLCIIKMWMTTGCQGSLELPAVVLTINKWLQFGNSVCNPIIYGLRNEEFRRTFRKLLLCLCCKKVGLREYDKNAHRGVRKERNASFQCEAGSESVYLRSVTPSSKLVRDGYSRATQSDHPIKLKILATKSLPNAIQEQNEDRAHHSFPRRPIT